MNPSEFYEFLPVLLFTEAGYLIFAALHWRYARKQLPSQVTSLVYFLIAIQFFLIFMHAWTFNWVDTNSHRFWDLNWERNVPTVFSTMQMALVGVAAFVLCLMGDIPHFRRVYIGVSGAVFLLSAYDEYLLLHEHIQLIREFYVIFGFFFVLLSLALASHARRDSKSSFYLYIWVAIGISVAGFGAFTVEAFSFICLEQFGLATDYCLRPYPLEEALENLGTLFILIGIFSEMKRAIATAKAQRVIEICALLLIIFLGLLKTVHWFTRVAPYAGASILRNAQQVSVELDDKDDVLLHLRGWSIEGEEPLISEPKIALFLSTGIPLRRDFGYSFKLLNAMNLEVVSSYNHWKRTPPIDWVPHKVLRETFRPWQLDALPANRAFLLTLTFWQQRNDGEYENIPIAESDLRLLGDYQIVLGEYVVPPKEQSVVPPDTDGLAVRFGDHYLLQSVAIPASAHSGEVIAVSMTWQALKESSEDWIQFLHFVHEETGVLWNHDQEPLGSRLPTRLWYAGLRDTETWEFALPDDLLPGRYEIYTGLYRLSDMARMPVRGTDGILLPDARVPLGSLTITDP